jgi:hypothetical protein
MSATTIELEPEQTDAIVVSELKEAVKSLQEDFRMRQNGELSYGIFHNEIETDLFKLEEAIKAFNTVLDYFSAESTQF